MSIYVVPQRELSFIFDEIVAYNEHCQMPGFEEASPDLLEVILPEAAKFFEQVVAPTNPQGDKFPAHLKDGEVIASPGLNDAYSKMVEAGWCCTRTFTIAATSAPSTGSITVATSSSPSTDL